MKYLIWLLLTVLIVVPVVAAPDCPTVVETALATTDALCETTGRNQVCYGNVRVDAEPQPGIDDFHFDQAGDRVPVTALQSLRLSPMEVDSGAWGVAMMRLQASIPSATPEDVTLLMFGDVKVENGVQTPQVVLDATVSVDEYINVRRLPSTRASIMGVLAPGQTVRALERLEDGSWVRIEAPDSDVMGWVDASLVTSEDDLLDLSVTERWTPRYRPMQAFYFESGENNPGCPAAPTSGLLIQTPEGVGRVTLLINEVSIRIGSTAFVEARPGDEMRVTTVEGSVEVEAMGETQTAAAGSEVSVPMDEHNEPSGPPRRPRPYNQTEWESLPVEALDENIEDIPDPLTEEEIEQVSQPSQGGSAAPTAAPTDVPPTADPGQAPPASGGRISLSSVCQGRWVVRNSMAVDVGFEWKASAGGGSGGGVVSAGGSASIQADAGRVRITYDVGNGPETSAARSSDEPCGGDSSAAAPPTQSVESTDEPAPPADSASDEQPGDEPSVAPTGVPPTEEPTSEPPTAESVPTEEPTSEPPTTEPPPAEGQASESAASAPATAVQQSQSSSGSGSGSQQPPPASPAPANQQSQTQSNPGSASPQPSSNNPAPASPQPQSSSNSGPASPQPSSDNSAPAAPPSGDSPPQDSPAPEGTPS